MIRIILLLAALLLPSAVHADDRRPLPVPSTGGVCPSGYSHSPTSGYCVAHPNSRGRAIPKAGAACPPGIKFSWHIPYGRISSSDFWTIRSVTG
jgi:hypothetical protein